MLRFTTETAILRKALEHVSPAAERRSTIPILSNVLLTIDDLGLALCATNMEIRLSERVPTMEHASGACTAPAKTLASILKSLDQTAPVSVEQTADGILKVASGHFVAKLCALPAEDFPTAELGDVVASFIIKAPVLRALIERTKFAISVEETRYYLNGIYFHHIEGDGAPVLRAVATDGHRMALFEVPAPEGSAAMPGMIVPRQAVVVAASLLSRSGTDVSVQISKTNKIRFQIGNVSLETKVIDGAFPDYEKVIPANNPNCAHFNGAAWGASVAAVGAVSTDRSRPIRMDSTENAIVFSAADSCSGTASLELNSGSVVYAGKPMQIGFQARYIRDIATRVPGEMELQLADGKSPAVILSRDEPGARYVLMPMRT